MLVMKRQAIFLFVFVVFPLGLTCAFAEQRYVDADAAGANDGSSWENAYNDLQDALADANSNGDVDEILVAQGVYKPAGPSGDRTATFQLMNNVAIKGGYAGFGAPDPNLRDIQTYETILSGDLNGDDGPDFANNSENSLNVVTGSGTDGTAVIDGFTVTAGNANILDTADQGGGMFTFQGDPTINNCIFSKNYAVSMGGGVFNRKSSPTITNCTIIENRSDDDGGGMRNYDNSHAIITRCKFINNSAGDEAGGLANRKNSNAVITYCEFIGNVADAGGGMENHVGKAAPTGEVRIANCIFIGNTAIGGEGGGMRSNDPNPTTTNCIFIDNIGGGMHNMDNIPFVINCIFRNNSGGSLTGSGSPIVTFCNVQGGYPGTGNIDADPLFVQPDDYHLSSNSPCIDAGDPNFIPMPGETDFDGLPRVMNGRVDMGVYEFSCKGDLDGDGQVDGEDFGIFFSWWLETGCGQENDWCDWADSNRDGQVNMDDLLGIIRNWMAGTGP
jgi:hypothetical protein